MKGLFDEDDSQTADALKVMGVGSLMISRVKKNDKQMVDSLKTLERASDIYAKHVSKMEESTHLLKALNTFYKEIGNTE